MSSVNIVAETKIVKTSRVKQLSAMFDVPASEVSRLEWHGDFPYDAGTWNVGLIVGASGCGKSTIARNVFGEMPALEWKATSVIDDFAKNLSIEDISQTCSAVGFNTIPAWMRPYHVLSTGEKFRVDIARRMLELADPIVVDEFTSVVDRQVAQIGAHAVQKYVRKHNRKFVAVSCHYDILDWLNPDWVFEPATMSFARRSQRRRPTINIEIARVPYAAWQLFAPFHYLTNELHRAARCFVLFCNGQPASFGGMLHRPHPKVNDIMGLSRLVTLPDWQGLGLAMILSDMLGAAYKTIGKRMHTYPAHPSLIRSYDHSKNWILKKKPGIYSGKESRTSTVKDAFGGRPCAVFEYGGGGMERTQAMRLLGL